MSMGGLHVMTGYMSWKRDLVIGKLRCRTLMLIWFFMILFKNYLIDKNLMN